MFPCCKNLQFCTSISEVFLALNEKRVKKTLKWKAQQPFYPLKTLFDKLGTGFEIQLSFNVLKHQFCCGSQVADARLPSLVKKWAIKEIGLWETKRKGKYFWVLTGKQGGHHRTVNYIGTQSFIIFLRLVVLLLNLDWLVQTSSVQNFSTNNFNHRKGDFFICWLCVSINFSFFVLSCQITGKFWGL